MRTITPSARYLRAWVSMLGCARDDLLLGVHAHAGDVSVLLEGGDDLADLRLVDEQVLAREQVRIRDLEFPGVAHLHAGDLRGLADDDRGDDGRGLLLQRFG